MKEKQETTIWEDAENWWRKKKEEEKLKIIKDFLRALALSVGSIILTIIGVFLYKNTPIPEDVLSDVFSTIVQSLVALIALLGMVTIYRLQIIRRDKENIAELMCDVLLEKHEDKEVSGYTTENTLKRREYFIKKYSYDEILKRVDKQATSLEKQEGNIKGKAILFFVFTILLLIVSLILLPMSLDLVNSLWNLALLRIIIISSFISFLLGLHLIFSVLEVLFISRPINRLSHLIISKLKKG